MESDSNNNTPSSPILVSLSKSVAGPNGVKSNLKSPVWTIYPKSVLIAIPNESGIL